MNNKRMKWSKEKIIKELKKEQKKVKHPIRLIEIENRLCHACDRYFGSFNKAKEKAGLKINDKGIRIGYLLPKKAYLPSKELAWLIGYILGDGYLTTDYTIGMKTKDRDIKDIFIKNYKNWCGHENFSIRYEKEKFNKFSNGIYKCKRIWVIRISAKEPHSFIKNFKDDPIHCLNFFPKKYWKFLLKGLWDAEGSITCNKDKNKINLKVGFTNYDNNILKLYEKLCLNLGFHVNKSGEKIEIANIPDVLYFIDNIGVTIKRKIKKVNNTLQKIRKLQKIYNKIIKLRSEGVSRKEIARLNKETPISTIEKWIYDERVPHYISYRKRCTR